jgi:hypothetical protein
MEKVVDCKYLSRLVGKEYWDSLPVIQTNIGFTGYLDGVKHQDMVIDGKQYSLVRGKDQAGRVFLSFYLKIIFLEDKSEERCVYTIFQRYSTDKNIWVFCISHDSEHNNELFTQIVSNGGSRLNRSKGDDPFTREEIFIRSIIQRKNQTIYRYRTSFDKYRECYIGLV